MKIATRITKRNDWKITSKYGYRIHPTTKLPSFHSGIDFGTNLEHWNIYGLEEGIVTASNYDDRNGNYIWIEYPRVDLKLFHCHLLNRQVKKGDLVNNDTVIGQVGKTGGLINGIQYKLGIHLHLGVKRISTDKYFDFENYEYYPSGEVSGAWDIPFTKLLQSIYKTVQDGIISRQIKQKANENIHKITWGIGGSNLVKAIQRESGYLKVDGYLGKNTIMYLQRKYGVKITGYIEKDDELVKTIRKIYGG